MSILYNFLSSHVFFVYVPMFTPNHTPTYISWTTLSVLQTCYINKEIPSMWKLYKKKDNPLIITNYRPIALANTTCKFYTSTPTTLLTKYGEQHKSLHYILERFWLLHNIARQEQMLITALEDAKYTTHDIYTWYITYINFQNAFDSIDHAWLLAIMEDLEFPTDAIYLISNIYVDSSTSFHGSYFKTTSSININRGTIQGDTLSSCLFIIFLQPLLRRIETGSLRYYFNTCTTMAYDDDLAIITNIINNLQQQIEKILKFCKMGTHGPQPCKMRHHMKPQQSQTPSKPIQILHTSTRHHV